MKITNFHAAYYSYLLTQQNAENMLIATLQDSRLDLNPHQVEAALFALRSPFNRGIIEADEVGLGKTIVAGLVIAQKLSVLLPMAKAAYAVRLLSDTH